MPKIAALRQFAKRFQNIASDVGQRHLRAWTRGSRDSVNQGLNAGDGAGDPLDRHRRRADSFHARIGFALDISQGVF